ncbi:MAG: isopentenyl-diphosphate Delta-isomerase [Candidatus Moranbacteria bacterium]|nr:isopentenyl-diphosphate Delta-isomerase [Candidatus Moranbacteria bacterium]
MEELINIADEKGNRIGEIEKMEAHMRGVLHEAFSIFIFNDAKQLLLQRRAQHKYHSGGLWTNTCCSHARVGEELESAAHRRLEEEMGFDTGLEEVGTFIYKTDEVGNSLIEHEFDHIFFGYADSNILIAPDPDEVSDWKWMDVDDIRKDIAENPGNHTAWFKMIVHSEYMKLNRKLPIKS